MNRTDLRVIQIFELPDADFKITVNNMFRKRESR